MGDNGPTQPGGICARSHVIPLFELERLHYCTPIGNLPHLVNARDWSEEKSIDATRKVSGVMLNDGGCIELSLNQRMTRDYVK